MTVALDVWTRPDSSVADKKTCLLEIAGFSADVRKIGYAYMWHFDPAPNDGRESTVASTWT